MTPAPSLGHTIWLRQQQAAFVYLPKVACTSWKLYLWQALGHQLPDGFDYRRVHDPTTLPLPYVASLPAERQAEFMAGMANGSIASYAVVREPRARILSAYLDKIRHHANPDSFFSREVIPAIQSAAGLAPEQRPSFADFLSWIGSQPHADSLNDHWRPMTQLLGCSEAGAYSRLWRMQEMEQAISFFAELLDCRLPFPSRQQLGERRTYDSQTKIANHFGEREQRLFQQLYAADLQLYAQLQPL